MNGPSGVMLSEKSQTKTNIACYHLHVNLKKRLTHRNRVNRLLVIWLLGDGAIREKMVKG